MKNKNHVIKKKLLNSNWTAVTPQNKEKHFTISFVETDDNDPQIILSITLTAIMTNKSYKIDYIQLKDDSKWIQGWN